MDEDEIGMIDRELSQSLESTLINPNQLQDHFSVFKDGDIPTFLNRSGIDLFDLHSCPVLQDIDVDMVALDSLSTSGSQPGKFLHFSLFYNTVFLVLVIFKPILVRSLLVNG